MEVQLGNAKNPPGYAKVIDGPKTLHVNWQRQYCTCIYFGVTGKICKHIRAVQDVVADQQRSAARARFPGTDAEYQAKIQADIDEIFDER